MRPLASVACVILAAEGLRSRKCRGLGASGERPRGDHGFIVGASQPSDNASGHVGSHVVFFCSFESFFRVAAGRFDILPPLKWLSQGAVQYVPTLSAEYAVSMAASLHRSSSATR